MDLRLLRPTRRAVRYGTIAALSFALGSATIAAAGPVVSGWVGLTDAGGHLANITAAGELTTRDAGAAAALTAIDGKLATDANGLKVSVPNDQRVTDQLLMQDTTLPSSGMETWTFDVSRYEEIRILGMGGISCPNASAPLLVLVYDVYEYGGITEFSVPMTQFCMGTPYQTVLAVPGTTLTIRVQGPAGASAFIAVWGR